MHPPKSNDREPITVTVNEACKLSGFGPTSIWKFLKDGRLTKVRLPGVDRTLVTYDSLRRLLEGAAGQPGPTSLRPHPGRPRGRPRKVPQPAQPAEASA